ncbi:MAG: LamG domain-containing protein, partial [Opitutales bacterium]
RRVLNELMVDYSSDLYIGAAPDHGVAGYFLGIIDDVRLYKKGFGSEDVYHLYKGDPGVVDYAPPRQGVKFGMSGSLTKVESPTLPTISVPALTYGNEIKGLDLGQSSTLSYNLTGLPPGLTNETSFLPSEVPGLYAWYDADANGSLVFHDEKSYDRNDTVALDNLLLYLPFDETNGSIAYDVSGNGHHGRLIDQAGWTEGKTGGAVSFDGSNDGLAFEKVAYLDTPESFTIAFWFKRYSDVLGIPTNHQIDNLMVAQSSSYDNDNLEIGSEGSEIEIYLDSGNGGEDTTYSTSGASITNNNWHHLVVAYGNGLKVFVDGVERLNQTPYSGPLDSSQDSPLSLGMGRIFSDQWGDFNGSIDDFRIYNIEVNSSQVATLYNSGGGDFGATVSTSFDSGRIELWKDKTSNQRHAQSSYEYAPVSSFDPTTGKKMVKLDYGKILNIPEGVSMPITVFLVGYETGYSFPDRELFTLEGWRMINSGNWALRRWDNNNPSLTTSISSSLKSLLSWTISRYGYELRVNGDVVATNVSGNWRPEALFDRITGDTEWMAGEILLYPRVLELAEKQEIEGYLAKNWKMQADLPEDHPYKFTFPKGAPGFVISGTPERAGIYEVSVTATNQWGNTTGTFDLEILATPPQSQTADATQIGSTSARLQANVLDLGGMDGNL